MQQQILAILYLLFLCIIAANVSADENSMDEPNLPMGLETDNEPAIPFGLDSAPTLPEGLSPDGQYDDPWESVPAHEQENQAQALWQTTGFAEVRFGQWRDAKKFLPQHSIAETRIHLTTEQDYRHLSINLSADLLYDDVATNQQINLESGQGWLDIRIANIIFSPFSYVDVKLGRQILTWGTGDLIFINDLFPKDWNSFLIGRDDRYLKAPSDAIKASLFSDQINVDIVYMPRFDADRYINGERTSYYNPDLARITGTDAIISVEKPEDDELAVRLYRNISTYEVALYGYKGYWKSPGGVSATNRLAIFPRLNVYGASIRGPLIGGIAYGEGGVYDSLDDSSGNNPLINNSEQRLLVGYEHELISNLTLSVQLYITRMLDYSGYRKNLPSTLPLARQNRHEVSTRIVWMTPSQKLTSSLFLRYSTSDNDYYLRPNMRYSMNDHWSYEVGGNIFYGEQKETFFGQFKYNDNIYVALRYGL